MHSDLSHFHDNSSGQIIISPNICFKAFFCFVRDSVMELGNMHKTHWKAFKILKIFKATVIVCSTVNTLFKVSIRLYKALKSCNNILSNKVGCVFICERHLIDEWNQIWKIELVCLPNSLPHRNKHKPVVPNIFNPNTPLRFIYSSTAVFKTSLSPLQLLQWSSSTAVRDKLWFYWVASRPVFPRQFLNL